jgi:hypothetical protein
MPRIIWQNISTAILHNGQDDLPVPLTEKGLISTEDCISEILYGTIMALTFTCTISITKSDNAVQDMLIGALSCNIAWGFVDAVMYLLMLMTDKERGFTILNFVLKSKDSGKAQQFIVDALPPEIAEVLQAGEVESIRQRLLLLPGPKAKIRLSFKDYIAAAGIFFIVVLSTIPVALPFIFNKEVQFALRISNIIAILMMFLCGLGLGKYTGRKPFVTGIIMSLIGIVFVLITIALGG